MSTVENIWSRSKKLLVVVQYESTELTTSYREAIKHAGLNINDCHLLLTVKDRKEVLKDISSVSYLSEKDFNLLGRLKNEQAAKTLGQNFDLVLFVADPPKRISKLINKKINAVKVGVNSNVDYLTINMNSEDTNPAHLISFVKNTLQKIK